MPYIGISPTNIHNFCYVTKISLTLWCIANIDSPDKGRILSEPGILWTFLSCDL